MVPFFGARVSAAGWFCLYSDVNLYTVYLYTCYLLLVTCYLYFTLVYLYTDVNASVKKSMPNVH